MMIIPVIIGSFFLVGVPQEFLNHSGHVFKVLKPSKNQEVSLGVGGRKHHYFTFLCLAAELIASREDDPFKDNRFQVVLKPLSKSSSHSYGWSL